MRIASTAAAIVLAAGLGAGSMTLFPASSSWTVRYSPRGGCTAMAVEAIGGAKTSIRLQGYGFTSLPIADALTEAHRRGVDVQIVLDRSNSGDVHSQAKACATAGIPVWIDAHHAIAHNKILIIDGKTVLTGSFNWTAAAESSNAENLLLITDPELARRYTLNWQAHRDHSTRLP